MVNRVPIPTEVVADVLTGCRRRCCLCFSLKHDDTEKKGQIAHLDHDPSNAAADNLAFLCLDHHDQYDSRTSQSKGLTIEEVKQYRTELLAFVAKRLPASDDEIVSGLLHALDRPAFRTSFRVESSLSGFRRAIAETIDTLNTGRTPQGSLLPAKGQIRDAGLRSRVDEIVEALVALRASYDALLRDGDIRPCGCGQDDCPTFMMSHRAIHEMDRPRERILDLARKLLPSFPGALYDLN
jgi:hypothetical protein